MLAIQKVCLDVGGYLLFPLVSIIEQFLLVIQQFLVGLCRELKVWALRSKQRTHKMGLGQTKGGYIYQFLGLKAHKHGIWDSINVSFISWDQIQGFYYVNVK